MEKHKKNDELVSGILNTLRARPPDPADVGINQTAAQLLRAIARHRIGLSDRHPRKKYKASYRFGNGYIHLKTAIHNGCFTNVLRDQAREATTAEGNGVFIVCVWPGSDKGVNNDAVADLWILPGWLVHEAIADAQHLEPAPGFSAFAIRAGKFDIGRMQHLNGQQLAEMDLTSYRKTIDLDPIEREALQVAHG